MRNPGTFCSVLTSLLRRSVIAVLSYVSPQLEINGEPLVQSLTHRFSVKGMLLTGVADAIIIKSQVMDLR